MNSTQVAGATLAIPFRNASSITVFVTRTVPYMKSVYTAIAVVAFLSNIFVVSVFVAFRETLSKQLTTASSNFHIFWQSCVDGCIGLILCLNMLLEDDGTPRYKSGNLFDEIVCRLWMSKVILSAAMDTSALAVLLLNFERFMAICRPITHRIKFAQSRRLSMAMILSTICLTLTFRSSFGILTCRILEDGRCAAFIERISPTYQRFMGVSTFLLNYVFPLACTIFFYVSMALRLHRKISPDQQRTCAAERNSWTEDSREDRSCTQEDSSDADMIRARNNILKTSALLSVSFIACWSTNQFYRILYYFGVIPLGGLLSLYYFSVSMVFANSCMNPFIYCLKYKPFRNCVKAVYVRVKEKIKSN